MESPAFSDPRQTDVAAVREMLDAVTASGKDAKLPVMTTAELCALGSLAHPLLDEHALAWWQAQPDHESLARRAYDQLARRRLLDPAARTVSPQLGVILAGRARPAFIAVSRERPDADPTMLQVLGIADETAGLRAVLLNISLPMIDMDPPLKYEWAGPMYNFFLTSAPKASRDLAKWAAERKHRTVDFYLPGSESSLPAERFVVSPAIGRLHVEKVTPATVRKVTCARPGLADMLLDTMTGACK